MTPEQRLVQRQAFAGLIWTKQVYHFDVARWLDGDPAQPPPPPERRDGRNREWRELNNHDVISMPDGWEYPWYAAWDLAFHCLPLAQIDPVFAKRQLLTLLEVWYQHPNGQLPAYEWNFSDVNPPVHAWAAWRVYKIDRRVSGRADRGFLERAFLKLLLNFTWWVNRKDAEGHNVFQGGFLGLDNIGVFDRSKPLPVAGHLGQADGTAWMGTYCLSMLAISLELAREEAVYEDMATKFFEHFLYIAAALNDIGGKGIPLWNEEDAFFYDVLHFDSGRCCLCGCARLSASSRCWPSRPSSRTSSTACPIFRRRMNWFLTNRTDLASLVARFDLPGMGERRLLALVHGDRLRSLLRRMLNPDEFLSTYGVRSLSRFHRDSPYTLSLGGQEWTVDYEPAESHTAVFGGNSNWRGPVWFPLNYLLIEALQRFDHFYGPDFKVEHPVGSGAQRTLGEVAADLSARLESLFLPDASGRRPVFGDDPAATDPSGATRSCSTNTSTAIPARALARRTRPAGRRSWPSSWSRRRRPNCRTSACCTFAADGYGGYSSQPKPLWSRSRRCGSGGRTRTRWPMSAQSRSGGGGGMHRSGYDGSQFPARPRGVLDAAGVDATPRVAVGAGVGSDIPHSPTPASRAHRSAARSCSTYFTSGGKVVTRA